MLFLALPFTQQSVKIRSYIISLLHVPEVEKHLVATGKAGGVRVMASHPCNLIKGVQYTFTAVDMLRHLFTARTVKELCVPTRD